MICPFHELEIVKNNTYSAAYATCWGHDVYPKLYILGKNFHIRLYNLNLLYTSQDGFVYQAGWASSKEEMKYIEQIQEKFLNWLILQ